MFAAAVLGVGFAANVLEETSLAREGVVDVHVESAGELREAPREVVDERDGRVGELDVHGERAHGGGHRGVGRARRRDAEFVAWSE